MRRLHDAALHPPFSNVRSAGGRDLSTNFAMHDTPAEEIKSVARPKCALCGDAGEWVYRGLSDRLFDAWGRWDLKRCPNPDCGLIWPDPMPLPDEVGKAYAKYYTHAAQQAPPVVGRAKRLYLLAKRSYWSRKYGYPLIPDDLVTRQVGWLMHLLPLHRRKADTSVRYLPAVPQGRVLDVGCGAGEWLVLMRELGWQVEGVDFDRSAVDVAVRNGLQVRCGSLEQQNYPTDSFDAVTLNHVIEHVPEPLATVRECLRVLKPGGKLVVLTPNSSSLSHRCFKNNWRGLEPPRHLHIFSMRAMRSLLETAGFQQVVLRPDIAASVIYESVLLQRDLFKQYPPARLNRPAWFVARLFNVLEMFLIPFKPSVADCLGAIATKR